MSALPEKILILDGIGGVPLGREICDTFAALGSKMIHFDCLQKQRRPLYALRSAYAKAQNRRADRDGFCFLPKLVEKELQALIAQERPSHILVIGFAYKFYDPRFLRRMADQFQCGLFLYDTDSCNLYPRRREFVFFIENELPIYDRIFSCSQVTSRFFSDTCGLNAVHLDPVKALFWSAVVNGVVAAPLMVIIMLLASRRAVMGTFTLPLRLRVLGWTATAVMAAITVGMFATF